jgi:hypothetical protein
MTGIEYIGMDLLLIALSLRSVICFAVICALLNMN